MFREYDFFSYAVLLFASLISVEHCFASTDGNVRQTYNIQQLTDPVEHGEGPHWDAEKQLLYFVDISGKHIYQYDPCSKQVTTADIGDKVGAIVPVFGSSNKFIIGRGTTLSVATWNGKNSSRAVIEEIHHIELDKPMNRFNDGKSDRVGRLWIGTMNEDPITGNISLNQGALYRFSDATCKLEPIISNVTISNGLAWSLDNRFMYYIDTQTNSVDRYSYNINTGEISNRQTVINFKDEKIAGSPDGMTIDNKGNLWIACWNGSKVINVDTMTGKVIAEIPLPVERVTSVAFGGRNYETLYITTMRKGLSDEQRKQQPAAGALFSASNLGVAGLYSSPVRTRCVRTRRRS